MSQTIDVRVPNLGDFADVPVIEVLVKPGDTVKKNDSLVTLESDKASIEVPSSADGTIAEVKVKVGDKVNEGTVLVTLSSEAQPAVSSEPAATADPTRAPVATAPAAPAAAPTPAAMATSDLVVPDVGDFTDIPVIEVLIKPGDQVTKEQSLVVLESDKASMEVPSSASGTIGDVRVKVGDKVSKGTVIATLITTASAPTPAPVTTPVSAPLSPRAQGAPATAVEGAPQPQASTQSASAGPSTALADARSARDDKGDGNPVHASPSIRRLARELGVALSSVHASGPNGRITRDDLHGHVKSALQSGATGDGATGAQSGGTTFARLPAWPKVDYAQYGEVERTPLSRIKRLSGPNLHRNWLQIPHITNYDEADITDLEAFRTEINAERAKSGGAKLTMLAFLVKASVASLQRFVDFNASLDGDALVHKHYYNIGFAADTPNGLIVPVIKNAQDKGLLEIAQESADLAGKARDGKLGLGDMQGGTFTISSIGGIGGTAFTQIVNAPEVAILGATRSAMKPVWDGKAFQPRLMLPISVSYDHRVIDGASAARFLVYLAGLLRDFRRVML